VSLESALMLIDGMRLPAVGGEWIESDDPFRGRPWARVPRGGAEDVDAAVGAARRAFRDPLWRDLTATARGRLMRRLAALIADNVERLAALETRDNGKLLAEMRGQLAYIPDWFDYFGGLADKVEGRVLPIDKSGMFVHTRHEPLGVIAAITPWNSPLLLATWKLAPALAAGNTVVWKPSEYSSMSALAFADLFDAAGFPPGVVNVVTGYGHEVGARLVSHPDVAKVAFTGGDSTGRAIYEAAATSIKPVTLELGGKSANIVFADADIDNAVRGVASGIFAASGQTCIAGSRALVEASVRDEFVEKLVALAKTARLGDPADPATQVGPVTTRAQHTKILDYIEIAKSEGAQCVLGGRVGVGAALSNGWFVEPTIFTGVHPEMRIAKEEVFGPVLSIIPFDDEDEAVSIANNSIYGLAAGLWTSSTERALRLPARLDAGTVWVNCYRAVSFMAPFGGYKRSGIGRENGAEAIHEYLQTKCVWMDASGAVAQPFVLR
jgi:(Z)-2-((N-methylformamido)methylene)-5-hydroxybutyrolactone dehydrogenase